MSFSFVLLYINLLIHFYVFHTGKRIKFITIILAKLIHNIFVNRKGFISCGSSAPAYKDLRELGFNKKASCTGAGIFGCGVQSACQQSIDTTDGEVMQHIMKMCREAKALHTRPNGLTSWVHLDHWPIAWRKRKEREITQRAGTKGEGGREYVTEKVWIIRATGSSQDCWHTPHSFHDSSEHEARAGLEHQNFATSVDVPQSQHLGERVIPQVAEWQGNTSRINTFIPLRSTKTQPSHQLPTHVLTHQIFPGSRPWYIIARMRQDGFRIVTVFSYLDKHKMGTTDNSFSVWRRLQVCHEKCLTSSFSSWCTYPGHIQSYLWMLSCYL